MTGCDQPSRLGLGDERHVIVGRLHGAEAGLRQGDPLAGKLVKIGALQSGLKNYGSRDDAHVQ